MLSKIVSSVSTALDFNQATLSGCIDIIVVKQPDGSLKSTPFHVRFGRMQLLRSRNKVVNIFVNDTKSDLDMQLGAAGEAFFLVRANVEEERDWIEESNEPPLQAVDWDRDSAADSEPPEISRRESIPCTVDTDESAVPVPSVEASLCGHLLSGKAENALQDAEVFEANIVTFDTMDAKAALWFDPSLVFRFYGQQPYYPSRVALPLLASWTVFGRGLSFAAMLDLMKTSLDSRTETSPFESPPNKNNPEPTDYGVVGAIPPPPRASPIPCCEVEESTEEPPIPDEYKRTLRPTSDELNLLNLQPVGDFYSDTLLIRCRVTTKSSSGVNQDCREVRPFGDLYICGTTLARS